MSASLVVTDMAHSAPAPQPSSDADQQGPEPSAESANNAGNNGPILNVSAVCCNVGPARPALMRKLRRKCQRAVEAARLLIGLANVAVTIASFCI